MSSADCHRCPLVDRCVCTRRTFAWLLAKARALGLTTRQQLTARTRAGRVCACCHPYLEAMLATGATAFQPARPGEPPLPWPPEA